MKLITTRITHLQNESRENLTLLIKVGRYSFFNLKLINKHCRAADYLPLLMLTLKRVNYLLTDDIYSLFFGSPERRMKRSINLYDVSFSPRIGEGEFLKTCFPNRHWNINSILDN